MMNKISRILAISFSLLIASTTLWSCDKESEEDTPEGTGVFVVSNATNIPIFYLVDGSPDTVVIDSASVAPIVVFKAENSQATPAEYFLGKQFTLYKFDQDSIHLVPTFTDYPVTNELWVPQKKDDMEFGITQYTLFVTQGMIE